MGRLPQPTVSWVTLAGCLLIFAADRLAQSRVYHHRALRHQLSSRAQSLLVLVLLLHFVASLSLLDRDHWPWLAMLGVAGAGYIGVSANRIPSFPGFKEVLGACCFTLVVWGVWPDASWGLWSSFFMLALSNLTWSSWHDRIRDANNRHRTCATRYPRTTRIIARVAAAMSLPLWWLSSHPVWLICSLLHLCWVPQKRHIDLAFLPLFGFFLDPLFLSHCGIDTAFAPSIR